MNDKFKLIVLLLLSMSSLVSAATEAENLHTLAICFLVLCIIVLIIVIIMCIVLHRKNLVNERHGVKKRGKTSMYNLSSRERSGVSGKEPIGFYGVYQDPQPADSIYLPLDEHTKDNGNYAHLAGYKKEDEPHNYEELKTKSTFGGPTYDNPGATVADDDNHDYEQADFTIVRPNGATYENPPDKKGDSAF